MIIVHPEFLARLFASMRRKRVEHAEDLARPSYVFDMQAKKNQQQQDVVAAPRVVAGGDLWTGWFLRAGKKGTTSAFRAGGSSTAVDRFPPNTESGKNGVQPRSALAPPPHIAPLTSRLPFGSYLDKAPFARWASPFTTRASVSSLIVIAIYLAMTLVACIYKSNVAKKTSAHGYGEDYTRTGLVAMVQVPLVIALGVRGNIIGLATGQGYDRLRIFHKIVGRVCFVCCAIHTIFYLNKWGKAGTLGKSTKSNVFITGMLAFAATCLIIITSLPAIRRSAYYFFKITHIIGVILLLVGLAMHVTVAVPWVIASGAIYLFSIIMQLMKTRFARAELVAFGGSTTTLITIPGITAGWRAGQHVRLRVLNLPYNKCAEAHPFTIASAPDSGGLVLMAKAAGDWTSSLYHLASSGGDNDGEVGVWKRKAHVMVEGPYGGLGHTLPTAFSSIVLIAGGSGISHSLSLTQDLIERSPTGVVGARTIDLVWVVRVQQTARALMPTLNTLVERARVWEKRALDGRRHGADLALPIAVRIHIFVTRCPDSSPLTLLNSQPSGRNNMHEKLSPSASGHGRSNSVDSSDSHGSDESGQYTTDDHWALPVMPGVLPARLSARLSGIFQPTAAQHTKADWLAKNPDNVRLTQVYSRPTDPLEAMSEIFAYRGRPDLNAIMASVTDETISRHGRTLTDPTGIFVSACGPEFLVNDARDATLDVKRWKRNAVGGTEFSAEFFGF